MHRIQRFRPRPSRRYPRARSFQDGAEQLERVGLVIDCEHANSIQPGNRIEFGLTSIRLRMRPMMFCSHRVMNNHQGQFHGERRALIGSATRGRDGAAVKFRQLPGDRQTEAETTVFSREARVCLTETLEYEWQEVRRNSATRVADLISTCEFTRDRRN